MEINAAFAEAFAQSGMTLTQIAALAGVSESAARKWLPEESGGMRAVAYQRLRNALPGFAELVDSETKTA